MTHEPFKDTYRAGELHAPDGRLMNKYAKVLNTLTVAGQTASYRPPPTTIGIAVITDAADTGGSSSEPYEISEPPKTSLNLYFAKFRYYDIDETKWLEFDEDLRLDANAYWERTDTDASASPASGKGNQGASPFGQIPIYRKGDVVVCFWDEQRGWLVPISPPFSDVPAAEFFSSASESISQVTQTPNQVDVYLETREFGEDWVAREKVTFRMPTGDDSSWQDTRSGFLLFKAEHRTQFRLRAVNTSSDSVTCVGKRVHFAGAGRFSASNFVLNRTVAAYSGGTVLKTTWEATASIAGRYLDSPAIAEDEGTFQILFNDTLDAWVVCVLFDVCISGTTTSTAVGMTDLIEITDSDGSFTPTDDYTLVSDTAVDCLYRGRIVTHDPDNADTCVRANVDDGADVWLKIRWSPWVAPRTQALIGMTVTGVKAADSHTNGALTFPLYEATWKESEIYGVEATTGVDWTSSRVVDLYDPQFNMVLESGLSVDEPAGIWPNVLPPANPRGHVIKVGDLLIPLVMERRAQEIEFTIAAGGANIMHAEQSSGTLGTTTLADDPPNTSLVSPANVFNPGRFSLQDSGGGRARWNSDNARYEVYDVNRSDPIFVEFTGTDGAGLASIQDSGSNFLCVWDATQASPNTSSGDLCGSSNIFVTHIAFPIWFSWAGPDNLDPNTADPTYPHFVTSGDKELAYDTGRTFTPTDNAARRLYEAPRDTQTYYGKAYENWTDASPVAYVRVRPCDDLAGNNAETTVSHTVYIPRNAQRDPNVVTDDVISYRLGMDNLWVIHSPDGLDAKIGSKMDWVLSSGGIPPGWAIMDGVANASGSGINALDRYPKFASSAGTTGGENMHEHDFTLVIEPHTISTGDTLHSHFFSVEIAPHSVSELRHRHEVGTTPLRLASGSALDQANVCSEHPVVYDSDCTAASAWGPLYHQPFAGVTSESGFFKELDHEFEYMVEPANHEPRHVTIVPIERIDNSV